MPGHICPTRGGMQKMHPLAVCRFQRDREGAALKSALAVISVVAICAFSGCATAPPIIRTKIVTVDVPVYVHLPYSLTIFPGYPTVDIQTNADLADYALQCTARLNQAGDQLSRIRKLQPAK